MQHVALRDDDLLPIAERPRDDFVAAEPVEDIAGFCDARRAHPQVHQMQLVDLEPVVAKRERVGVALKVELARRVQQKVGTRLI